MEQMKIVRGATPIVLLLYLIIREYFFFSSKFSSSIPQHEQHDQISFVSKIFVSGKPSYLVVFFTFNMIVVALLVRVSAQFSSLSSSSSPEVSILSFIDFLDEGLKSTKDEEDGEYHGDFLPRIVHVEYKEEKFEVDHDQSYDDDDDYCYNKDEIIISNTAQDHQSHGRDDEEEEQKDEILTRYGYCDYDEEMSEDDSYSELDDDDFNKRIEEFIDENNKKWREELQNEKLIYVDSIVC